MRASGSVWQTHWPLPSIRWTWKTGVTIVRGCTTVPGFLLPISSFYELIDAFDKNVNLRALTDGMIAFGTPVCHCTAPLSTLICNDYLTPDTALSQWPVCTSLAHFLPQEYNPWHSGQLPTSLPGPGDPIDVYIDSVRLLPHHILLAKVTSSTKLVSQPHWYR